LAAAARRLRYGEAVRIAFATDERNRVTHRLVEELRQEGHEVEVLVDGAEWPEVGRAVGDAVASGSARFGIVCCATGTGVSMAANKVPGVRAALCGDAPTAQGARQWNDANVLAIGLRLASEQLASEIVHAFVATPFDPAEASVVARVEPGP
jgi:ribose 5-phosphate isomerase B